MSERGERENGRACLLPTDMLRTHGRSTSRIVACLVACIVPSLATAWAGDPAPSPRSPFAAESIAEGVFLIRPTVSSIDRTNSILVQREDGSLVIESQPSVESARELLATIAQIDPRPIRFLVLSNPHVESIGGATAFPDSTLVIGSAGCGRLLADPSFDPGAEMRAGAADAQAWVGPPLRPPVFLAEGPVTLADPRNPVVLSPVGEAHTEGDLLVELPRAGILYAGAILSTDGNPYASDGDLTGWLDVLHGILRLDAETLIPLRGARGTREDARRVKDGLAWVRGQVEAGLRDGVPWEGIPKFVVQSYQFGEYFDPKASPAFHALLVEKVLREADEQRIKRMMPSIVPPGS